MNSAHSWIAAWQSLAPVTMAVFAIVMMKWLSRHWADQTVRRTARVVSNLGKGGGHS
jgi:hypothetical protein